MDVLVIEDDVALAGVVVDVLESEDISCGVASTIEQALTVLATTAPALVLLDQNLPDGAGMQNVGRVKAAVAGPLPVIIFSASLLTREIVEAAGADGFLAKPFDIDALLDVVEHYRSRA